MVVGVVWLVHTTAIDRLEVTKLCVALLAVAAAALLAARRAAAEARQSADAAAPGMSALGVLGLCLLGASLLFGDFVGARVEGWAPWIAAAMLFGLARRGPAWAAGNTLSILAGVLALIGVAQALGVDWFIADVNAFGGRAVMGTLGNPDLYGVCLAGALPFAVVRAQKWRFVALAALVIVAIVASGSRTAWVMTLPAAVLALRRLPWRRAALLGVVAMAGALLLTMASDRVALESRLADLSESGGTAAGRLYLWRVHGGLLAGAGPLGGGPQGFQRAWPWAQADYLAENPDDIAFHSDLRHAHADPVEIAVDWGWVGLLLAGWWVFRLLRSKPSETGPGDVSAARTSLIALLLGGLALPVLFQTPSLLLAATSAGLLAPPPRIGGGHRLWRAVAVLGVVLALGWVGRRTLSEAIRTDGLRAEVAGQLDDAREQYGRAARVDPHNPLAHWMVARSLLDVDPAGALRAAEAAIEGLPTAPVFALRALAAERAGEAALAAESWAIVERLRPEPGR